MAEEKKASRIKVEELPQAEEELTAEEAREVQGGATRVVPPGIRSGGTSSATADEDLAQ